MKEVLKLLEKINSEINLISKLDYNEYNELVNMIKKKETELNQLKKENIRLKAKAKK